MFLAMTITSEIDMIIRVTNLQEIPVYYPFVIHLEAFSSYKNIERIIIAYKEKKEDFLYFYFLICECLSGPRTNNSKIKFYFINKNENKRTNKIYCDQIFFFVSFYMI